MGNPYLERLYLESLGLLPHEVAGYSTGELNEAPENTPPAPGQLIRSAQADTLPTPSTDHESHSLDGYVRVGVALDIPAQGADHHLPILTYRDPTHYPFSWSPPLYTIFGPNAGCARINSQFSIHSERISLTGNLAHIQGLDFRNLGRGDGATLPNNSDLPLLPNFADPQAVWRRHPYNLTYIPLELNRDDQGNLLMPGEVASNFLGGQLVPIQHYPTLLLWREGIPYGVNAQGALVCSESERNTVVHPFPTWTHLREEGLPSSLDLVTLANMAAEAGPYQGQLLEDTLNNRCGSTRLRFNIPTSMRENPLAFVPSATVEAHLMTGNETLQIPGNREYRRPNLAIQWGQQGTLDAEIHIQNGNSRSATSPQNTTWTQMHAALGGSFSLARILVENQALELPLSAEANVRAESGGILTHPETLNAHLLANGQVQVNGDVTINRRLAELFNLPIDIPEIRFNRNGPTYFMARGLEIGVSSGDHALRVNGEASLGVGLSSIQVPLLGLQTGGISTHMRIHGNEQAIIADVAAHAVLPRVAFPAPLSGALERGWLSVPHLQFWLGQGSSLRHFTAGVRGDMEVGDISTSVKGNHIEMSQAGLRVEGRAHVQEGLVEASLHFDAAIPRLHVQTSGGHPVDANLRIGASGDLHIYDSPLQDARGDTVIRRHMEVTGVQIPLELGVRGLPLVDNIRLHGNSNTIAEGTTTRLGSAVIFPGIHITSYLHPGESLVGRRAQMTLNYRVSGLVISTPLGRFRISGQLVGRSDLVNISQDPGHPQLRPVVGSLFFELRHANIRNEQGQVIFEDRALGIHDNAHGQISISDSSAISLRQIPETVRRMMGLPEAIENRISIPIISFNADAIDVSSIPQPFSSEPFSRGVDPIHYYEPSHVDQVHLPAIAMRNMMGSMGTLVTHAQAHITGIQSGHPHIDYRTSTPLRGLRTTIHHEEQHVNGSVALLDGHITVRGNEQRTSMTARLPGVRIDVTKEFHGILYHIQGTLRPRSMIIARANLSQREVIIPKNQHDLAGDLTITATRPAAESGRDPVVLGRGTVHLTAPFILSGRANQHRVSFIARIPDIHLEGSSLQAIHQDEIQIPEGANLDLHLEGFEARLHANLPNLMRDLRTRRMN